MDESKKDPSVLKLFNKDKIWTRVKNYIYITIFLIVFLILILLFLCFLNYTLYSKITNYMSALA